MTDRHKRLESGDIRPISNSIGQAILDHGTSIVASIDDQCRIKSINRAPSGLDVEDVPGTSCFDYIPAEYHRTLRHAVEQVLRTGESASYESETQGPNGSLAWFATRVLPLPPDAGASTVLLVSDDITERRLAEAALQQSRQILETVVNCMPVSVGLFKGGDLRLQFMNDAYQAIASGKPLPGKTLEEIWPEAGQELAAICRRVLETGEPYHVVDGLNLVRRRPDGPLERAYFSWSLYRVPVAGEEGWGLLHTAWETTKRREPDLELQQAHEVMRASEERFRYAMEAAEEGLWDMNLVTNEVYCSPGYSEMLGYPPEARVCRIESLVELLHPDDGEAIMEEATRRLRDPGHYTLVFRMRAADGQYRWIESRAKVVQRDADGTALRAVGTHIDISERRRLEDALRCSEAQLRSIIEGTADVVYVKDLQGRYLLLNRAITVFSARDTKDVLGRDDTVLFASEEARMLMEIDRQVLEAGAVSTFEEQLTTADGVLRTFLSTKGPLRDATGQVFGLFGISKDITGVLEKEETQRKALEDSRRLLELALAGAELGTWDVDLPSGQSRYDARYCAMLGYGPAELEPTMQASQRLIHPEDRAGVNEAIRAHLNGETRRYEAEHRMRHKDGHWVWVLARGKATYDGEERPVRATGTILDITDRKRVATEGAELLRRFEALIAGLDTRAGADGGHCSDDGALGRGRARLSARNREVLGLLAEGLIAAEIAQRLVISKETVMTHRCNLMRKLVLRNKAELIRYAIKHNIGVPE